MSDTTPHHDLPLLAASQAQKHVTHNEAITLIDGLLQLSVISRTQNTPPTNPSEGDRYLVGSSPTDEWLNQAGHLAFYVSSSWRYSVPQVGWFAWIEDEAIYLSYSGTDWGAAVVEAQQEVSQFGINAGSDSYNRLTVKSDAILISHDDVTPGSGDIRINCNKASDGHVAAFLFQSNYGGRGEFGLLGNNDFTIKTTPDGGSWASALIARSADGAVEIAKADIKGGAIEATEIGATSPSSGQFSTLAVSSDAAISGISSAGLFTSMHVTVASDGVGTISPHRQSGVVLVTAVDAAAAQSAHTGLFVYRLGSSPQLVSLTNLSSCVSAGSTTLTGSTGAADTTSLSAQFSELQIENRSGGVLVYSVVFLGGEA